MDDLDHQSHEFSGMKFQRMNLYALQVEKGLWFGCSATGVAAGHQGEFGVEKNERGCIFLRYAWGTLNNH